MLKLAVLSVGRGMDFLAVVSEVPPDAAPAVEVPGELGERGNCSVR